MNNYRCKSSKAIGWLLLSTAFFTSGCTTFSIENREGIELAHKDIDRAQISGSRLKPGKQYSPQDLQSAVVLYNEARSSVNSYLNDAIRDAADYSVTKDRASYEKSGAGEKIQMFVSKSADITGTTPQSAIANVSVAATFIAEIKKLMDAEQRAAHDRFADAIRNSMMKPFDELPNFDGSSLK